MTYMRIIALALAVVTFASCSKDQLNSKNSTTTPANGDITVNINGYTWAAPLGYVSKTATATLTISGQANQDNYISIVINPYNGLNSYPFNGLTKITYYENNTQYQTITGQVTIAADDDYHIAGTFSGELVSNSGGTSLQFTNGAFDIDK